MKITGFKNEKNKYHIVRIDWGSNSTAYCGAPCSNEDIQTVENVDICGKCKRSITTYKDHLAENGATELLYLLKECYEYFQSIVPSESERNLKGRIYTRLKQYHVWEDYFDQSNF